MTKKPDSKMKPDHLDPADLDRDHLDPADLDPADLDRDHLDPDHLDPADLDLEELEADDTDLIDNDLSNIDPMGVGLDPLDPDGSDLVSINPATAAPLHERLMLAFRQGAAVAMALLIMGRLAERLRPVEQLDRGIIDTPFLWAIVVWGIALAFHAIGFEESQMRHIERTPLMGGLAAGAVVFIAGVIATEGDTFVRRLLYIFANSIGAVLFWWGLLTLGYLVIRRLNV